MHRHRLVGFVLALVFVAGLAGNVSAHGGTHTHPGLPILVAVMSGAQEVPGPGDPDGHGHAAFALHHRRGHVCFAILVANITLPATGAHIHAGEVGQAGPVVVGLRPPNEKGFSVGCVAAPPEVIEAISQNPSAYYVNVHTTDYPDGAVRGQLRGKMAGPYPPVELLRRMGLLAH